MATPIKRVAKKAAPKSAVVDTPKIHAKQLSIMVSVGTEDRDRDIEKFEADIVAVLKKHAKNVTPAGRYYILDGKVCLPADYDPSTQNFLPGHMSPTWAGGGVPSHTVVTQKTDPDPHLDSHLSKEEGDRRVAEGKARYASQQSLKHNDDDFEDIEWTPEMVDDEAALADAAETSIASAIKKTPKRIAKRTVTRKRNTL